MLFWISIFIFMVRTYVHSTLSHGAPLNLEFATMFSRDAFMLALSDGVIVFSTGICVPFAKLVASGWIRHHWTGVILQHTLQTTILFSAISWTFNRYVLLPPYALRMRTPLPVLRAHYHRHPRCLCRGRVRWCAS
jgi:sterol O-acyltransferase